MGTLEGKVDRMATTYNGRPVCTMPTSSLRMCTRPARYRYVRLEAIDNHGGERMVDVADLCAQHHRAGGHSRMLRPMRWEYDLVLDRATGIRVTDNGLDPFMPGGYRDRRGLKT